MLGQMTIEGVAKSVRTVAIVGSLHDIGPNELFILINKEKVNAVFSQGITSFVDLLNENYVENRFFVFKSIPQKIVNDSVSVISKNPITDDGRYVAFWGPETPTGEKKHSWPIHLCEKSGKEIIGRFSAIDLIKENGMLEMLYKIRKNK